MFMYFKLANVPSQVKTNLLQKRNLLELYIVIAMSIMMYTLRQLRNSPYAPREINDIIFRASSSVDKPLSPRLQEFKKKLRETTPIKTLEGIEANHPAEKEPLESWPDNVNPNTGEIGGPKGPEPTRFGDWERKGRNASL